MSLFGGERCAVGGRVDLRDCRPSAKRAMIGAMNTKPRTVPVQITPRAERQTLLLLDRARAVPGWVEQLPRLAAERGITAEQLEAGIEATHVNFAPMFESDVPRQRFDAGTGKKWEEPATGVNFDYPGVLEEHLNEWADCGLAGHQRLAQGGTTAKPASKRKSRSKEALRKARARAEGRVKPYQRKGAATVQTMIAATEASLATRKAKLAALLADPNVVVTSPGKLAKCRLGIERAEKTLETYRRRAAGKNPA
jgi:hypothetical protein